MIFWIIYLFIYRLFYLFFLVYFIFSYIYIFFIFIYIIYYIYIYIIFIYLLCFFSFIIIFFSSFYLSFDLSIHLSIYLLIYLSIYLIISKWEIFMKFTSNLHISRIHQLDYMRDPRRVDTGAFKISIKSISISIYSPWNLHQIPSIRLYERSNKSRLQGPSIPP